MTALSFAIQALTALPELIAAGADVVAFVNKANNDLRAMQEENRDPTDAEWNELNATVEALRAARPDVS